MSKPLKTRVLLRYIYQPANVCQFCMHKVPVYSHAVPQTGEGPTLPADPSDPGSRDPGACSAAGKTHQVRMR